MGQGGRTGQHRERETPLSFHPIFIKCKFSTSCSLCVGGGGSQGPEKEEGDRARKGHQLPFLNLGRGPPSQRGFPSGQRKSPRRRGDSEGGCGPHPSCPAGALRPLLPRPVPAEVQGAVTSHHTPQTQGQATGPEPRHPGVPAEGRMLPQTGCIPCPPSAPGTLGPSEQQDPALRLPVPTEGAWARGSWGLEIPGRGEAGCAGQMNEERGCWGSEGKGARRGGGAWGAEWRWGPGGWRLAPSTERADRGNRAGSERSRGGPRARQDCGVL